MSKSYYECHITLEGSSSVCRGPVEAEGWKFSAIDGDPVMGSGVKCYATRHYNARLRQENVLDILFWTAHQLEVAGLVVTRRKVELVIYDDRSAKVKPCDGACPECHLDDYRRKGSFYETNGGRFKGQDHMTEEEETNYVRSAT